MFDESYLTKEEQEYLDGMRVSHEVHILINIIAEHQKIRNIVGGEDFFAHYVIEMLEKSGMEFGKSKELIEIISLLKKDKKNLVDALRIKLLTYKLLMITCLKAIEIKDVPFNFETVELEMAEVEAETEKEILNIRKWKEQQNGNRKH